MSHGSPVCTGIVRGSYGTHLLNHLTADGTGFTAGELTVVTLVQLYADFSWCFSVT